MIRVLALPIAYSSPTFGKPESAMWDNDDTHHGHLDLNLLAALDALLQERHVTRAAERIGLSQPAMSRALGRLRRIFNDSILVRVGNELYPTPYATELIDPVH